MAGKVFPVLSSTKSLNSKGLAIGRNSSATPASRAFGKHTERTHILRRGQGRASPRDLGGPSLCERFRPSDSDAARTAQIVKEHPGNNRSRIALGRPRTSYLSIYML